MQIVDELIGFKTDKLGLKVASDYRRDGHNWWYCLPSLKTGLRRRTLPRLTKRSAQRAPKSATSKMTYMALAQA